MKSKTIKEKQINLTISKENTNFDDSLNLNLLSLPNSSSLTTSPSRDSQNNSFCSPPSLSDGLSSPKFCCLLSPAKTCCCGCTLQNAMYFFAVYQIVLGIVSLLNLISKFDLCILVSVGFMITNGVVSWKAAKELNFFYAKLAFYLKSFEVVYTVIITISLFIFFLYGKGIENILPQNNANVRDLLTMILIFSFFLYLCFLLADFYFLFIIWSFKYHLANNEKNLILQGIPQGMELSVRNENDFNYGNFLQQNENEHFDRL